MIAAKVVEKNPPIYKDVDDDRVTLGDGFYTLHRILVDRTNYLNRPHKRSFSDCSTENFRIRKKGIQQGRLLQLASKLYKWDPIELKERKDHLKLLYLKLTSLDAENKQLVINDL